MVSPVSEYTEQPALSEARELSKRAKNTREVGVDMRGAPSNDVTFIGGESSPARLKFQAQKLFEPFRLSKFSELFDVSKKQKRKTKSLLKKQAL
jgi:hypothetical protein